MLVVKEKSPFRQCLGFIPAAAAFCFFNLSEAVINFIRHQHKFKLLCKFKKTWTLQLFCFLFWKIKWKLLTSVSKTTLLYPSRVYKFSHRRTQFIRNSMKNGVSCWKLKRYFYFFGHFNSYVKLKFEGLHTYFFIRFRKTTSHV